MKIFLCCFSVTAWPEEKQWINDTLASFYCVLVGEEKYNHFSENTFTLMFLYFQTVWSYFSYLGICMPWFALCSSVVIIEFLLHSTDNAGHFYFQKLLVEDYFITITYYF